MDQQIHARARRKLHQRDLVNLAKTYPGVHLFACVKISDFQMAFWCPRCWREHRHGLAKTPFAISPAVAHCDGDRQEGYSSYFIFWDGTERLSRR